MKTDEQLPNRPSDPSHWGRYLFIVLVLMYFSYSIYLYAHPTDRFKNNDATSIAEGRMVWQKYNCQSCHQLYSLGGYLGPDLTNFYSDTLKGDMYLEAMVKGGTDIMPSFSIDSTEIRQLQSFLKAVNRTGIADPRSYRINPLAGIEQYGNQTK